MTTILIIIKIKTDQEASLSWRENKVMESRQCSIEWNEFRFWEWGPVEWNDMLADAQPSQQNLDLHDSKGGLHLSQCVGFFYAPSTLLKGQRKFYFNFSLRDQWSNYYKHNLLS